MHHGTLGQAVPGETRELQSKVRSTGREVKNKRGTLSDYRGHTMRRSKDGAFRGLHTQVSWLVLLATPTELQPFAW
ncbi:Hypp249 [Branchiostoma lanceolatum]|uniref:Hypp249 protein n=1 Tax=Branchiostoma lanceolatum TaxID=7740 RepID=A0A8J9W2V7_BRALA|nr:Hypp249 [Branchiostoma lanceolatum]